MKIKDLIATETDPNKQAREARALKNLRESGYEDTNDIPSEEFERLTEFGIHDKTPLSRDSIEALHYKAEVAGDSIEDGDPESADCWRPIQAACVTVARAGTVGALRGSALAKEELENYLGGDLPDAEVTHIVTDLCRAGHYERHNPDAVCTRRIRTRVVDGVRYVTGY